MIEELKTRYCIIGAGIAGLLVATKLVKAGKQVLVIDQGPDVTEEERTALFTTAKRDFHYGVDYNDHLGENVLTPTAGNDAQRLFGTGGTALHFGGWMVRPIADDLQVRKRFGYGRDWPLHYSELEPWLTAAELETGVSGAEDNRYAEPRPSGAFPMEAHPSSWFEREVFAPALRKLDMEGHSCPFAVASRPYEQMYGTRSACQGCRFCKFCPTGARYSPDRVHGAWLKTRPNATIRNGLSLRRLETSAAGDRIVAAHCKAVEDGAEVVVNARHFVLAMGGVATPRMLLLSQGRGHEAGLGNAGGQLGVGFHGHFNSIALMELDRHAGSAMGFTTMQCDHGRLPEARKHGHSWILVGGALPEWLPIATSKMSWFMEGSDLSLARVREALPRMIFLLMMHEMSSTGSLTLDPDRRDAFGSPLAHIQIGSSERDERTAATFKDLVAKLGREMSAKNSECFDPVCLYGHPSGATAMGKSPADGVCNADLNVFGVDNLHVCSASVFPHSGANPPTLTIAALALRLGAHLNEQ